ncbi:hypothetical protein JW890_07380 [candidate division WOR-3 bacterium]|nr:hypothetical protein [candidate division WOR-3 bacterium]
MQEELNNLKTLSMFHFIMSGFTALVSCFPLIHVTMGIIFVIASKKGAFETKPDSLAPEVAGWLFIIIGSLIVITGLTLAYLIFLSGKNLRKATRYTFCIAVACILCLMVPYGTVLGVFTIIILTKQPVKELFSQKN